MSTKKVIGFILLVCVFTAASINAQTIYSLKSALQAARANNPDLKTSRFEPEISRTNVVSARLRPNPVLNSQSLQLAQPNHFFPNTPWYSNRNRQVWWQFTKEIQLAHQREHRIEVADQEVAIAEMKLLDVERNLFLEVAEKWLDVWIAQKELDILQIAKNNIDSLVQINQIRFKNQVITQTDLFRTELLTKRYNIQYQTASQYLINKHLELKLLTGGSGNIEIDTADGFADIQLSNIDSLLRFSLESRSDIKEARALVDYNKSNVSLQRSLAIPRPEAGFIWNPQNSFQYFGLYATIELPLFNRNQAEIKKSLLQQNQAEQHLLSIREQLKTSIYTAYYIYLTHKKNTESYRSVLEQSQTILDNIKYAYLKGGTTIIDFLEAQRSWLETRQQYYDALQQYHESYIRLLYATGLINQLAL